MDVARIESGSRLGHYEIIDVLGMGGMGQVYRAHDLNLDREVAIKVLPDRLAEDPLAKERFEREARAIASLSHPNILTIYDFATEGDVTFAVMELLEGQTLGERLTGTSPLPVPEVLRMARDIARGLAAAHTKGLVHRDLKPANLFETEGGRVSILDFGLARSGVGMGETLEEDGALAGTLAASTNPGTILGTVGYMSPEQAKGQPATPASDIFSLGCVLHELASGGSPFRADTATETLAAILNRDPEPLKLGDGGAARGLEAVIARCLEKDPERRFRSAVELERQLASIEAQPEESSGFRRSWIAIAAAVAAGLAVGLFLWLLPRSDSAEAGLAELMRLIEEKRNLEAWTLAHELERDTAAAPVVETLWSDFTTPISLNTDPPGARVSLRPYTRPEDAPVLLATTPLEDISVPNGSYRWSIEHDGYRPMELGFPTSAFRTTLALDPMGAFPESMTALRGGTYRFAMPSLPSRAHDLGRFAAGRYEVTNREFEEFVEAGGYGEPEYWQHPFGGGGESLSRQEAMTRFVDRSGRPGPATWELGTYPEGQGDQPVSGISWFEAAAYARYAGGMLPTIYHWVAVATPERAPDIVPMSNFGSDGPEAAGENAGMAIWGAYDVAGNVREWCLNEWASNRFILGGSWSDPDYMFYRPLALSPFDRSPQNGMRLFRQLEPPADDEAIHAPVEVDERDFTHIQPVPESVIETYEGFLRYDPIHLEAELLERVEEEQSIHETVSITVPYGDERMPIHLFLPRSSSPPFQPVLYFPGEGAIRRRAFDDTATGIAALDFLIKDGRALVYPIYKSTYERGDGFTSATPEPGKGRQYQDHLVWWTQEVARAIDYLETREDIDSEHIGYLGSSWGAALGFLILPFEPRVDAAILTLAGLANGELARVSPPGTLWAEHPDLDIALTRRLRIPVLMLNGKFDFIFLEETHQRVAFENLGTPEEHKRIVIYPDRGHQLPERDELMKETLAWYDRYLGPVRRAR